MFTSAADFGVGWAAIAAVRALDRDVIGQAHRPRGAAGHVNGWMFACRPSNRQRNRWAVALLDIRPADQVLEIGFGPGVAIAELARAGAAHVYGTDHSGVMVRQATRRNAAAIRAGRVTLVNAPVDQLPAALNGPFDAILAVNSLGFWPAPAERLAELRQRLAPGGRIAIVSQPRCPGATADTSRSAAREIEILLRNAGLTPLRTETLALSPPAVCILATSEGAASQRPRLLGARGIRGRPGSARFWRIRLALLAGLSGPVPGRGR
jgi:SAM-dependent methyltransferase